MAEHEHGVEGAYYSGGPGEPYYQPCIECVCGWRMRDESWEEVGRAFDDHLKDDPPAVTRATPTQEP
jgi:hypothetical protein